jgi:hypothetical protein
VVFEVEREDGSEDYPAGMMPVCPDLQRIIVDNITRTQIRASLASRAVFC